MRVVAVDWSGRATGERNHLWMAEMENGRPVSLQPASRVEAAARLEALAAQRSDIVVGLDFGFSLPAWFLRQHGFTRATDLWAAEEQLEDWLRRCPPPFWGRPGTRRPAGVELLRAAERALRPQPKSVFQIGGAGAVGTGSLRGMPVLARLRAAGFAIWPFDPPRLPVVVEMWPRLLTVPAVVKSREAARRNHPMVPEPWRVAATRSEDAFDAAVAAVGMHLRSAELAALPAWMLAAAPDLVLEGWVFGAPLPTGNASPDDEYLQQARDMTPAAAPVPNH